MLFALAMLAATLWTPPHDRPWKDARHAPKPRVGRNIFSGEKELWLAESVAKLSPSYLVEYKDPEVAEYVQQLGHYLVEHSAKKAKPFRFVVTADREPNAESVGGGTIYVNRGLLQLVDNEDELACLMAHEIGHDEFGHMPKTVTRLFYWLAGIKHVESREQIAKGIEEVEESYRAHPAVLVLEKLSGIKRSDELQADRAAFFTTFRAGYNPYACVAALKKFDSGKAQLLDFLFSTHPLAASRAALLKWETNFVTLPDPAHRHSSAAFDEMKKHI